MKWTIRNEEFLVRRGHDASWPTQTQSPKTEDRSPTPAEHKALCELADALDIQRDGWVAISISIEEWK